MVAPAVARRLERARSRLPHGLDVAWMPHAGPQEAFIRAREFEVLYGGAKGGGKSDAIIAGAVRQVDRPAYKALLLRATYKELEELIQRSHRLFSRLPAKPQWNGTDKKWTFPNPEARVTGAGGAIVQFGYCEGPADVEQYQGREWGYIGYDELGNCADERTWTELLKEIRCPDPTVVRMARASANPGYRGHAWIKRRFIIPCGKDGAKVVRETHEVFGMTVTLTRRFIPARITDNPVYARDPLYLATLASLPEIRRRQLLDGDWDVGVGLALGELSERMHIIDPFTPPRHWIQFGGFDWGFEHRWVFTWMCADEDGTLYVLDTVKGWRDLPDKIIERIVRRVPVDRLAYVSAGHDIWNRQRARGENAPTIAERMIEARIPIVRANVDRVHGLNNLRDYIAYRGRGPAGEDWDPALYFLDTPDNRWLFEQLEGMVTDPDDPEDVLKVDVDPETGEGGDDGYDAIRYAVASRPARAPSIALDRDLSAFDPELLAYEADQALRVKERPPLPVADPFLVVGV